MAEADDTVNAELAKIMADCVRLQDHRQFFPVLEDSSWSSGVGRQRGQVSDVC